MKSTTRTLLITFTLLYTAGIAQKIDSDVFLGSWQLDNGVSDSATGDLNAQQTISFYDSNIYQIRILGNGIMFTESGIWKYNSRKKRILFKAYDDSPQLLIVQKNGIDYKVTDINDSSFVFVFYEDTLKLELTYHRVKTIPILHDTVPQSAPDQEIFPKFYLVSSRDTTQKVALTEQITLFAQQNDSVDVYCSTETFSGRIENLSDTTLTLNLYYEIVDINLTSGGSIYKEYIYESELRNLNLNLINAVDYSSRPRQTVNNIGNTISTFALITTLVVAPLVSINYKNGDFNANRYYTWAGAGLAGLSIGIPMILFSREKTYSITNDKRVRNIDYWFFVKEE